MSFQIKIQRNNSDNNALTKSLTDILVMDGTLREDTSIIDPVIVFEGNISDVKNANYMTIPSFGRSYFINDITSVSENLFQVSAHVDVLSSFASEIRANKGIIARQENKWNLYINDGVFKVYQNPEIVTQPFPNGFDAFEYILVVAGRGGDKAYNTPDAPAPTPGSSPSFVAYTNIRGVRDESTGYCTQYVVNRTQQALGVRCVLHYSDANVWMESSTVANAGWIKISNPSVSQILSGDVLVYDDTGNAYGHCLFVEESNLAQGYIIVSQSNVRHPGGSYYDEWESVIRNRHYRFSCVDIVESSIENYLGNHLIGIIRYTG